MFADEDEVKGFDNRFPQFPFWTNYCKKKKSEHGWLHLVSQMTLMPINREFGCSPWQDSGSFWRNVYTSWAIRVCYDVISFHFMASFTGKVLSEDIVNVSTHFILPPDEPPDERPPPLPPLLPCYRCMKALILAICSKIKKKQNIVLSSPPEYLFEDFRVPSCPIYQCCNKAMFKFACV